MIDALEILLQEIFQIGEIFLLFRRLAGLQEFFQFIFNPVIFGAVVIPVDPALLKQKIQPFQLMLQLFRSAGIPFLYLLFPDLFTADPKSLVFLFQMIQQILSIRFWLTL